MRNLGLLLALFAALLLSSACQGDDEEAPLPGATLPSPVDVSPPVSSPSLPATPYRGGAPPRYQTLVPIVPGEYKLPYAGIADVKYRQELAADAALPHFSGTVNGFRVYDQRDAFDDPTLVQKECPAVQFEEVKLLDFGYLPLGTYARTPQYAAKCEDGSTAWVLQEFENLYTWFAISYELGEKAVGTPYSSEYVRSITVAGHDGVGIGPLVEEGAGGSILVVDFASGFLLLETNGLPFSELEKMAEGVACAAC